MDDGIGWLVNYLSEASDLGPDPIDRNVFEAGWIDSFGTILLVEALEEQFAIRFNQEAFQDRRFATIRGIAEIVTEAPDA